MLFEIRCLRYAVWIHTSSITQNPSDIQDKEKTQYTDSKHSHTQPRTRTFVKNQHARKKGAKFKIWASQYFETEINDRPPESSSWIVLLEKHEWPAPVNTRENGIQRGLYPRGRRDFIWRGRDETTRWTIRCDEKTSVGPTFEHNNTYWFDAHGEFAKK